MLNALLGLSNLHQSMPLVVEIIKDTTKASLYTLVIVFEIDPCSFGVCFWHVWIVEEMF